MSKENNTASRMNVSEERKMPLSLTVSGMAICAALYAVGSYLTAYVPSPWGAGQFRPAVIVPAFFAVVFGPVPAGVGAALGTLIADSVKHGYLYPGSYLASVWGNFLGFFLFGLITRRFSWGRFVLASNVTLTVANFVVAVLYVMVFKILYLGDPKYLAFSNEATVIFILGLTVWWFVTMLPFVLLVTPVLVVVAARTMPSFVNPSLRKQSLKQELPVNLFSTSLLVPGVIMLILGLLTTYSSMGSTISQYFGATTMSLVQWMFLLSGITLSGIGLFLKIRRIFFKS